MLVETLWYQFSFNNLVHANGTLCKYLRKRNWSLDWQDCVTLTPRLICRIYTALEMSDRDQFTNTYRMDFWNG